MLVTVRDQRVKTLTKYKKLKIRSCLLVHGGQGLASV